MRPLLALLAFLAAPALAQSDDAALDACRELARQEAKREGIVSQDIVLLKDGALFRDRYGRKVGSQPVASILTGNGAVVLPGAPSAELSFLCLLADGKRAVFFNWLPRQNVSALAQCSRAASLQTKPQPCLELMLRVAEADLTQAYSQRFQEAHERGEEALGAYRRANDQWREYRDAECARRRELAPKGVSADDYELACVIELTRRRGLDMR